MIKIFVIGQCTLHWGRMEYGNIGNYYIIEPFFRELHKTFPDAEIKTTFQMSDEFCVNENVRCVPMSEYYEWNDDTLSNAYKEFTIASIYNDNGILMDKTPFIEDVLSSDLVVDFSGDIWGQNADLIGQKRFLVGLLKDRIVQLLGKPIAMLAGSPGPFNKDSILPFARQVFSNFNLVTNREPISSAVLKEYDFDTSRVHNLACPAFIFEAAPFFDVEPCLLNTPLENKNKPTVGFILCGWNMLEGPYSRTDWRDEEFDVYVNAILWFVKKYDINICLMSHANGFELPPNFKLVQGRDFPIVKRLYDILRKTDVANNVFLLDGLYSPKITKGIISKFDMLISGRVHGAVAGLSQNIPTVIIDYGHKPKAHKLRGFAQVADIEQYIASPASIEDLKTKINECWNNRILVHQHLKVQNVKISDQVHENFKLLIELIKLKCP